MCQRDVLSDIRKNLLKDRKGGGGIPQILFYVPQGPGIQHPGLSKTKYTKVMSPTKFPYSKTSSTYFKH